MKKNRIISNAALLLAAIIWGFAFVSQEQAAKYVEPFTVNGIRSIIGSVILIPLILIMSKQSGRPVFEKTKKDRKTLLIAGVSCGTLLCIAANFQQFGIALYPAQAAASGRSGFITALYVVLVPVFGVFFKKKVGLPVWISVLLAIIGMYLLCFSGGIGGIYTGDLIVLLCAFAFCMQILCIDRFIDRIDGVKLASIEFFVCGILSLIMMFIFENPDPSAILYAGKHILYLGVMSSGVAYTLQIIGQKYSDNPTVSSIVMSLESVFAAIGGWLLLGEKLTLREIIGCVIMFSAIIIAQLPFEKLKKAAGGRHISEHKD